MKYLNQNYVPHLILIDATYETTNYALPLFFAVIKTSANLLLE